MMPTLQNSFTWINANSVPKTLSPEFVQNCFTRDNAARSTTISPELMPPKPRQNGCRQVSLRWSFSDERLSHWHHIHDSVLTWCRGAGSASWRQGKGPKSSVSQIQQFFFEKQTFNRFLPAKRFAEIIFLECTRFALALVQFGWNSSVWRKQKTTVLMDAILKFGPFVNAFALNSFHKPRPLFGQFRFRKVGSAVEVDPMGADRPSLKKKPWHPWDRSLWWMTWLLTIYYGISLYVYIYINLILMICPSHHYDRFVIHWVTRDSKRETCPMSFQLHPCSPEEAPRQKEIKGLPGP